MITKEVNGNLLSMALNCEFDAIIHGCNCFNIMGAGIAAQIKKVFPEAYEADKKTIKGDINKLGSFSVAEVKLAKCKIKVINAYTQYDYKITPKKPINVDYDAIRNVFILINIKYKGLHIGIPKIGAGLAGGDWNKIEEIINEVTPDIDITLVNYRK